MSSTPTPLAPSSSKYSADLQQVLTRSISIASLPLTQLNSQLTALQNRSTALDSLNGKVDALLTAMQGISSAVNSTSASSSDPTVLLPHSDPSAQAGTYTIHIADPGAAASALSNIGLPALQDPFTQSITTSGSLTLTIGSDPFTITPAANTLSALADAINSSGANVTATIINLGSPSAPDYKLTVQSTKLGAIGIQLNDGTSDLLSPLAVGSEATYQVNGQPATPISSDSRTVTIAPGVTVDLLAGGDAIVVVSKSASAQSNALSSLVAAYNAVVDELSKNRGQGGGALAGDALISTVAQSLRNLSGFSGGTGGVQNITDLGLTFDKTGKLSFNSATFASVSAAHGSDVSAFLGSPTTGGFLKSATDILNGLTDPSTGTIESTRDNAQKAIDRQNQTISDTQTRIDTIAANLTAKISAADALIASLEQQVSYFTTLFTSMNDANKKN